MNATEATADGPRGPGMVELENVHKIYMTGSVPVRALAGVELTIGKGEFVSVMGPSGCGKSTLLNIIGAIDAPTQGRIRVAGIDLLGLSDDDLSDFRRDRVGFVYQFYNLIPSLTAYENIELPLAFKGRSAEERRARVTELLDLVGLEDRADHTPSRLSGGEQQRVAIARALANSPDLMLLDEPTGDLDSATGEAILGLLKDLNRTQGVTLVLVSHDLRVAQTADRTVLMEDGRIIGRNFKGDHEAGEG